MCGLPCWSNLIHVCAWKTILEIVINYKVKYSISCCGNCFVVSVHYTPLVVHTPCIISSHHAYSFLFLSILNLHGQQYINWNLQGWLPDVLVLGDSRALATPESPWSAKHYVKNQPSVNIASTLFVHIYSSLCNRHARTEFTQFLKFWNWPVCDLWLVMTLWACWALYMGHHNLVAFGCLFASKKMPNNAVMPLRLKTQDILFSAETVCYNEQGGHLQDRYLSLVRCPPP